MDIKKVVQLTNEQYEELLKNGQIEVNGEIKTKDDETIYVCPASESWAELNNKIDEAIVRPYKVSHTPIIIEDLETYIENFYIEKGYTDSYLGLIGVMKKGDVVKVIEGCDIYINGSKIVSDYTYTGDNLEFVTICMFATTGPIIGTQENLNIIKLGEIYINQKGLGITLKETAFSEPYSLTNYGATLPTNLSYSNIVKLKSDGTFYSTDNSFHCQNLKEAEILGTKISLGAFTRASKLEKASFPNVTEIVGGSYNETGPFQQCTNEKLILKFPKLTTISGSRVANTPTFEGCSYVELPETLTNCTYDGLFSNTKNIILNCINCVFKYNSIASASPKTEYLRLAEGWNTNINLNPFTELSVDNMVENFNNLKDLTEESSKTITIPTIIYNALTEEQLLIAISKNWTIAFR